MNIDLNDINSLLLHSNKSTLKDGLTYISKIKVENKKNIYYSLTHTTSSRDIDIDFLIFFLLKTKYIKLENNKIIRILPIDSENLINDLIIFYYSLLIKNSELNDALFKTSEFTIINDDILINILSVKLKYRSFFTILQNLELISITDKKGYVLIKNYILAQKYLERPLRKISPEEFAAKSEQNKIYGIEAEKYVLCFESIRLNKSKEIEWVAEYIVNEGYDIASFNNDTDDFHNRFIEVKSFEGDFPYFYWSRNEVEAAKLKKEKYWIYLVNRKEINNLNYSPLMIQNPYKSIFENENWNKQIENYKIELKSSNNLKIV
jgi:hypothetical protein